jgi:hypothetical protein
MAITIHWELRAKDQDQAQAALEAVRAKAEELQFAKLGNIVNLTDYMNKTEEEWVEMCKNGDISRDRLFALVKGRIPMFDGSQPWTENPETLLYLFLAYGRGTEGMSVMFGKSKHFDDEWGSRCFCTTEFSANRVAAHKAITAILDVLNGMGLVFYVKDDTGYWDHRDSDKMLEAYDESRKKMEAEFNMMSQFMPGIDQMRPRYPDERTENEDEPE